MQTPDAACVFESREVNGAWVAWCVTHGFPHDSTAASDPWTPAEEDALWIEVASEHRHASPRVWCVICQRIEKARANTSSTAR